MMVGKHQISYLSRKLIPKECNLAAAQKEDLTIVQAVEKWLSCLKAFTSRKDHWDLIKNSNHFT